MDLPWLMCRYVNHTAKVSSTSSSRSLNCFRIFFTGNRSIFAAAASSAAAAAKKRVSAAPQVWCFRGRLLMSQCHVSNSSISFGIGCIWISDITRSYLHQRRTEMLDAKKLYCLLFTIYKCSWYLKVMFIVSKFSWFGTLQKRCIYILSFVCFKDKTLKLNRFQ